MQRARRGAAGRVVEMPAAVAEHPRIGLRGDHLGDEQVMPALVLEARQPAIRGAPTCVPASRSKPQAPILSACSRPEPDPAASTPAACALDGRFSTNSPEASTSSRVKVLRSMMTTTFGGMKSSGIAQAAAMTSSRPAWALLTSVTGPWLSRR